MSTLCVMATSITSLMVLLFLALGRVSSEDQDVVHRNSFKFRSTNGAAEFSRAEPFLGDEWCPAVCPVCPACPPCQRQIPPGYRYHDGLGYYKMHYEHRTWPDAKGACEREGGYMVVLNSQKEANLANSFLNKYNIDQMLMGFLDVNKKGNYVTVLGDALTSTGYTVWAKGEPNNVGKENCGFFYANRGYNDGTCNFAAPFLCELFA